MNTVKGWMVLKLIFEPEGKTGCAASGGCKLDIPVSLRAIFSMPRNGT